MKGALDAMRVAAAAGFFLVGLGATRAYIRTRHVPLLRLALAIDALAVVSVAGQIGRATDYRYRIVFFVSIGVFLASGYLLFRFRESFVPARRPVRILALAANIGAGAAFFATNPRYGESVDYEGAEALALLGVVLVWNVCTGEPAIRFWRAAARRPIVQRARLRSLSLAYASLIVVLLVALAAQPARESWIQLAIQGVALALIPVMYVAVAPPVWLRRVWREGEEESLRRARALVAFAPDRATMAGRALEYATRLVGADGGAIFDEQGNPLASQGVVLDELRPFAEVDLDDEGRIVGSDGERGGAIIVPVHTASGNARMVIWSGPFAFLLAPDELKRLRGYADNVGAALDRVKATEDLRRLDAERSRFISNAAHELRTPLAVIVGMASFLRDAGRDVDPEVREVYGAIARQSERMHELVNNLLDLTQLEQGRMRFRLSRVPVREAIDRALTASPPPGDKIVDRNVEDVAVQTDAQRFDQVLTNLLVNAYRYGGKRIEIAAYGSGDRIAIEVRDDGEGIPERLRPHLFEPFHRGADTGSIEGSGLGLAIVRNLLEALKGSILYQPEGSWTRFVVELPKG